MTGGSSVYQHMHEHDTVKKDEKKKEEEEEEDDWQM